jgi:hypothetical protein
MTESENDCRLLAPQQRASGPKAVACVFTVANGLRVFSPRRRNLVAIGGKRTSLARTASPILFIR